MPRPLPRPDRGLPPQRRPLARAGHRGRQGPRLAQRPQARPHRHAPPRPRGRGPRRAGGDDRPAHGRGRAHERDRGPARAPPRHRVLEGRARRADRGGAVRRRPQAPPAAGRLPVGAGRPAHHLRPQALQRRARLPGAAGPRDQPLPQGAAPAAQGARWRNARTNPRHVAENEPGSPQPPANDDAPAGRKGRADGPGTLAKRTRAAPRRLGGLRPDRCHPGRARTGCSRPTTGRASPASPPPAPWHPWAWAPRPGLATGAGPVPVPAPGGGAMAA